LNAAATLIYPSSAGLMLAKTSVDGNSQKLNTEHFQFTAKTGENATIVVPLDIMPGYSDGRLLEIGDEIGVFTSMEMCCGALVWQGANAAFTVWGDDSMTESVDGFQTAEVLHFRVWHKSTNTEYAVYASFQEGHPNVYQANGFSVLAGLMAEISTAVAQIATIAIPMEFKLLQNYPNPFLSGAKSRSTGNPATTIEYHLPQAAEVNLSIYDLTGQEVRRLVRSLKSAGSHTVPWDGRDEAGRSVATGIYFYQIEMKVQGGARPSYVDIKKMILM
jgi:hypothetical protein